MCHNRRKKIKLIWLSVICSLTSTADNTYIALSLLFVGFRGSADSFQDVVRTVVSTSRVTFPGFLWGLPVFRGKSVLCLFYLLLLQTHGSTPGGKRKQKHLEREPHLHPLPCLTLAYSKVSDILTHTSSCMDILQTFCGCHLRLPEGFKANMALCGVGQVIDNMIYCTWIQSVTILYQYSGINIRFSSIFPLLQTFHIYIFSTFQWCCTWTSCCILSLHLHLCEVYFIMLSVFFLLTWEWMWWFGMTHCHLSVFPIKPTVVCWLPVSLEFSICPLSFLKAIRRREWTMCCNHVFHADVIVKYFPNTDTRIFLSRAATKQFNLTLITLWIILCD